MVRLAVYNIEYCEGIAGEKWQYLEFWRVFRAPKGLDLEIIESLKKLELDILALVEIDSGSIRSRGRDEGVVFEKALGMRSIDEIVKYPIKGWLSMYHRIPILRKQSNAIMSRYPFKEVKHHLLKHGTKRVVIEAVVDVPEETVLLLAHLSLGKKTRTENLKELCEIVNRHKGRHVVLMGDFNTFNGEDEIMKLLRETHLEHHYELDVMSQTFTYPAYHPCKRLDYVLTSPKIKVNSYNVLNFQFSDHMPIMVDFDFRK